jgi:hypothetical protein
LLRKGGERVDTGTKNRALRAFVALAIACAVGGPSAAEELARVRGDGYGAATQPAVTNDPPAEFTSDATEHDVDEGLHFSGIGCYDLRQGARDDDKQAWADTDFIHWIINGATLDAEGRLHDSDPKEASICSSEAWGAEFVAACVKTTEGDYGTIVAENRIGFSYSYLISGSYIGEASVQLQGNAFDIHGAQHTFNLSDQRSEKVGEESEEKVGFTAEVSAGVSATLSNSPRGPSSSVRGGLTTTAKNYREVRASVNRRFAAASGDTGSTPPLVVQESISGSTPLERDYQVFSDAGVVLRARAGQAPGGQNSTVLIDLHKFKVENSLKVWKSSGWNMPEPPDAEPPPTTTPREPDVPAPPGNGGGEPEPGDEADGDPDGAVEIPEFDGLRGHGALKPPRGLDDERGTLPGSIQVGLSDAAPRDLIFGVQAIPEDLLTFAGHDRLVVRQGRRWGSLPFHASRPGEARVQLTPLDEAGLPTASLFEFDLAATSIHDEPETLLWATVEGKAWAPGRNVAVRGLAGTDVGPLYIGRLGFAGLDASDTPVTIEVDDPSVILSELPGSVAIPPGEGKGHASLAGGRPERRGVRPEPGAVVGERAPRSSSGGRNGTCSDPPGPCRARGSRRRRGACESRGRRVRGDGAADHAACRRDRLVPEGPGTAAGHRHRGIELPRTRDPDRAAGGDRADGLDRGRESPDLLAAARRGGHTAALDSSGGHDRGPRSAGDGCGIGPNPGSRIPTGGDHPRAFARSDGNSPVLHSVRRRTGFRYVRGRGPRHRSRGPRVGSPQLLSHRSPLSLSPGPFATRGVLAALSICMLANVAAALGVRAIDPQSGAAMTQIECGLVDPATRSVYARFKESRYRGDRTPRPGDILYVYRRGYDLAQVALTPDTTRTVEVRMKRATSRFVLRIQGAGDEGLALTVRAVVRVQGLGRDGPVRASWTSEVRGDQAALPLGRGIVANLLVETEEGILWPHSFHVEPGREYVVHHDRPHALRVRLDENTWLDPAYLECLPDLLWRPGVDPRRVDAWRWRLNRPGWLEGKLPRESGSLPLVPDVPFHLFARIGNWPVYRFVGLGSDEIDLRGPHRLKRVEGRPIVDGEPAPAGARIAPGRLDAYAINALQHLEGCSLELSGAGKGWGKVLLPAAEWLTIWHAAFGLAHLEWSAREIPEGKVHPGLVLVTLPTGHVAEGYVSLFPVWKGAGTVRTVPPDAPLRKRFGSKIQRLRFPGLPPGLYGMDTQVELKEVKTGRVTTISRMGQIEVKSDQPTAVYRLSR